MNKKISIKMLIIIVLIGIICVVVLSNINNKNIKQQEESKEQLGETTEENAYVEMQTHLSEVNEKEQKLISFKSTIARAITDKGVKTSEDADANTMASNIRSISGISDTETSIIYQYDSGSTGTSHEFTLQSDRQLLTMTIAIYSLKSVTFNPTFTVKVNGVEVETNINDNYDEVGNDYVYRFSVGSAFINASAGDVISVTLKQTNATYAYLYPIVCI